ncbi:hypothetical protein F5144DRAFT_622221 [Chaetomium tenue]|uniref:Uncharacterized protein n=1 Tax=Chaetomium tenue TaxID=1854479 RepID=A0ACB7P5R1_9PEZI|nr:hypothetical protein F5144DRAFT_622221 [Chaetomium globosum]
MLRAVRGRQRFVRVPGLPGGGVRGEVLDDGELGGLFVQDADGVGVFGGVGGGRGRGGEEQAEGGAGEGAGEGEEEGEDEARGEAGGSVESDNYAFGTAMERLIAVCLSHRDHFSEGHMRGVFSYEAYHWGLMITPKVSQGQDCHIFDATDATEIDPVTFRMRNPTMDWWFRDQKDVDPALSPKLIGRITIGRVPDEVSSDEVWHVFKNVPLPVRNRDPQQSCVTWAVNAILALQALGWVREFEIDQFKDWALSYADMRMKRRPGSSEDEVTHYGVEY